MRLEKSEKQDIIIAIEAVLKKDLIPLAQISLFLFGSRTQKTSRGGDIDLLLRVPGQYLEKVKKLSVDLAVSIKNRIGDQKIDLLILDLQPPKDPFHKIAVNQSLLLKRWG